MKLTKVSRKKLRAIIYKLTNKTNIIDEEREIVELIKRER